MSTKTKNNSITCQGNNTRPIETCIPGAAPAVKDLAADFVAERGSSSIKNFSLVEEKDQKSAEQPTAKKLNSHGLR